MTEAGVLEKDDLQSYEDDDFWALFSDKLTQMHTAHFR